MEIIRFALKGLEKIYRPGYTYKKAGIIVGDIVPQQQQQLSLFDSIDRQKQQSVMSALDKINDRMGRDKVRLAVQGQARQWKMKREKLSPSYSTRIDEALTVYL
jgi:DNA polymerase V